jgi:phosphatidylserine decarboxylase
MSIINSLRSQLAPVHPQGYPFIGGFALASLILFWLWAPLGWLGTLATCWCAYFFRDPVRVTPLREGLVVAPADGRVTRVRLPREPKPGIRPDRADGLSAGRLHQRRTRQGERGQ